MRASSRRTLTNLNFVPVEIVVEHPLSDDAMTIIRAHQAFTR